MKKDLPKALKALKNSKAHRLAMLLKGLHMALTAGIEEQLRERGIEITRPQALALLMLADNPGASNADLARMAAVSPQTMHQILVRLEREGLVDRKPHPYLGRVLTTEVSEKGLDLVARGSAIAQSVVEGATSGLSDQEQDKLISLLGRCLVSMGVEPQPGTMD